MFRRVQGRTKLMWLPVTPSTDFPAGALVAFDNGKLVPATTDTPGYSIIGVIRHAITEKDSDYDQDRLVEVEVPIEKNVIWEATASTELSASNVGQYYDLDDSSTVNLNANTNSIVFCVKDVDTTKGWFILNIGPDASVKA